MFSLGVWLFITTTRHIYLFSLISVVCPFCCYSFVLVNLRIRRQFLLAPVINKPLLIPTRAVNSHCCATRWRPEDPQHLVPFGRTSSSGLPAEIGWKIGLVLIAGQICSSLGNGPFSRAQTAATVCFSLRVKLQHLCSRSFRSFIC